MKIPAIFVLESARIFRTLIHYEVELSLIFDQYYQFLYTVNFPLSCLYSKTLSLSIASVYPLFSKIFVLVEFDKILMFNFRLNGSDLRS